MSGAVDVHRHRLVLVRQQSQPASDLVGERPESFAASVHPIDDLTAKSCVGDVNEVAHRSCAVRCLVGNAARVQSSHQPVAQYVDRLLRIDGYSQRASEVSARAERHHRELAARRKRRAVAKEAVHHLVQGAVTADRDHHRPGLVHSFLRDLCRFEWPGRERDLVRESTRGQPGLDRGPLATCFAPPRRRVDYEQDRRAGPRTYLAPPTARGFINRSGSMPSWTARQTRIHPPISSATHRARAWPTPCWWLIVAPSSSAVLIAPSHARPSAARASTSVPQEPPNVKYAQQPCS